MGRGASYPSELRERAVRMVAEVRPEYPSDWPAIKAVAGRLGIGSAETLRKWVRQAEVDGGARPGGSSEESAELRKLRAEARELRRANEILKAASAFSRRSSTARSADREIHQRAQDPVRGRADLPRADCTRLPDRIGFGLAPGNWLALVTAPCSLAAGVRVLGGARAAAGSANHSPARRDGGWAGGAHVGCRHDWHDRGAL